MCIGPDVLDAYITWNFDDYVFLGRWEWLLRIGGSSSLFSLVEILRFPAAILALLLSFAGCAGLSIAAAYLARTPR